MRDMADLDAVHLGLDENEADIAEELQDFDSFDTRSEASKSRGGSVASDSEPSISSVSTAPSSVDGSSRTSKRLTKTKSSTKAAKETAAKPAAASSSSSAAAASSSSSSKNKSSSKKSKRSASPSELNGKKKKSSSSGSESKSKSKATNESDDKTSSKSLEREEEREPSRDKKSSRSKKNTSSSSSQAAAVSGSKSDLSDAEDEKPPLVPPLESDSESSDSDSGTQHKRNGGGRSKAAKASSSKSSTPEKDNGGGGGGGSSQKSYDYMTKLNYLFRDTRFFLIKSNNSDNVQLSKNKSVWATLPQNDANLNQAFKEARNVLLIFSVNESGKFAGFARMAAPSRRDIPQVAWVLPPSISSKALGGVIELDWICRKELSFNATLHLHNTWNEGKPVKIGRDGQEIEPKIGAELCRLFPEDEQIELTPILRKSKETARVMREKGIHVIYKAPRSLSSRGHGGGRGNSQLGPMRHRRNYGGHGGPPHHHQRPYRHHHHHHHGMGMGGMSGNGGGGGGGGGFKRNGSPYRQMSGGGSAASGEMGMPSWERYMSSAAAAEAYVADYIRNMHGQLPPLPFVPPFGQMPLPAAAGGAGANTLPPGAPASMYEQLPPPVRYYDGPGAPPLPDYPPPQPMRPPPPGFDKAPSYEDFAAWKNAGLPTVAAPPGFPVYAANGGGNGNAAGGGGGPVGGASGVPSLSTGQRENNNSSVGGRRREYGGNGGNRSGGSSRQFRGDRGGGGGNGGQRSYRDARR